MSDILWPEKYLPGTTDNFVSNEVIVKGLSASTVWPFLSTATLWPTYYSNATKVGFDHGAGPELSQGVRFRFTTFGLDVEAEVIEYVAPAPGQPARIAWRAWVDGPEDEALDVLHAWLLEDLPGGRVRVLTQESQIGKPAIGMAQSKPNPMLNAHQDWLDGLVRVAAQQGTK
ncbi:SRPBCC domain-containing protein [Acidipila sp. EB88]|uniref:SRPBCC domain-containing protein n=1 Tax=Acidipila sp. EB88 TaxID=2305226 RepID=UPI000F601A69|nr:SRPBCC domain-containing protein [Acidipila sp. EB88]RRA48175.1 SRPBCC domain-containing protein [Acidipila sp. EB88]